MELTSEHEQDLPTLLSELSYGPTLPPREVVQAVLSLLDGRELKDPVVTYTVADDPTALNQKPQKVATWRVVGLTAGCLIDLTATRVGGEWYAQSSYGDDDFAPPTIRGSVIPLREVISVEITEMTCISREVWQPHWAIIFRDQPPLMIPWSKTIPVPQNHEALAHTIAGSLWS